MVEQKVAWKVDSSVDLLVEMLAVRLEMKSVDY